MSRAHFFRLLTDAAGNLVPNCQVRVLQPGAVNPIESPLYTGDTGSTTKANPFVTGDGRMDFYLDTAQRVRIGITDQNQSVPQEVFYENVDVYEVPGADAGVVPVQDALRLRTENGTVYEVTVGDDGTLTTTLVAP